MSSAIGEVQQEAAGGHRGTRRVKATGACEPRRGRVVPGPSRRPAVRPRGRPRCETGSRSKTEERSYYVPAVPLLGASRRGPTACPQSTRARACAAAAFAAAGRQRRLECSSSARDEPARRVWPRPRVRTRRRHTVPRGRARKAACFTIPLMRTAQKPEAGARGGAGGE